MDGPESRYQVSVQGHGDLQSFTRTYEGLDGYTAPVSNVRYVPLTTLHVPIREMLARYVICLPTNLRDIVPKVHAQII